MNILVTGANGIIGKELSNYLSLSNNVIRADITEGCEYLDVTNENEVEKFFENNKIDSVVHSAYPRTKDWGLEFLDVTNELFCKNIALQLGGAFNVLKHACSHFKKNNGGNLVMLGSVSGTMNPRF